MIRSAWNRVRRFARFVALAFGAGLRIVGSLMSWVLLIVGTSGIAIVAYALDADPLLILTALFWFVLIWFVLGAFRVWDRADTREPEGTAATGTPEMPPELRLRALAKNGRKLNSQLVGDSMMDRITANGVLPWVKSVENLLIALGPEYVQRFQDADDGVPTWNAIMQPGAYKDVMEKRLAVLEQILTERGVDL